MSNYTTTTNVISSTTNTTHGHDMSVLVRTVDSSVNYTVVHRHWRQMRDSTRLSTAQSTLDSLLMTMQSSRSAPAQKQVVTSWWSNKRLEQWAIFHGSSQCFEFLSARRCASAVLAAARCLSVCLFVASRCSIETAK